MNGKLKAIDFFCGAGGMTYGFRKAGIKVIAGIDIEEEFKASYKANNGRARYIQRDITTYHPQQLEKELSLGRFDDSLIFIGCSPCQYWSKVNTDKLSSSYTKNLLADFQRFVDYFRPGYIVVENVPGIKNKQNNHVLLNFLDYLTFNEYRYRQEIVNSLDYGIPQTRRRFLLIATRVSEKVPFPEKTNGQLLTVREFIGVHNGFRAVRAGHKDKTDFLHTTAQLVEVNLKRIKKTPKNGGTRLAWKDDPELQLPVYKGKDHQFCNVYSRMFWDKPAPTITTRYNSISNGRFIHPEEDRGLSLREGATLQTFPKGYKFFGNQASIAKQIGNAVPPELAKKVGLAIKNNFVNIILKNGNSY